MTDPNNQQLYSQSAGYPQQYPQQPLQPQQQPQQYAQPQPQQYTQPTQPAQPAQENSKKGDCCAAFCTIVKTLAIITGPLLIAVGVLEFLYILAFSVVSLLVGVYLVFAFSYFGM